VRVNDRGPFLASRIIDLSYTAAFKLGYIGKGSTELEVERLLPADIARLAAARESQAASVAPDASAPAEMRAEIPPAMGSDVSTGDGIAAVIQVADRAPVAVGPAESGPAISPGSGFYLQLGAFSQAVNAEAARNRLAQEWSATLPSLEVVQTGALYRLHGGPFASRADAAAAARRMEQMGAGKPVIVQR
jgi:rare lipoprotein A